MTTSIYPRYASIKGLMLGMGSRLNLVSKMTGETIVPHTNNAVLAAITLGPIIANARTVSIQLNNLDGSPIAHAQFFQLLVTKDTVPTALATTGGSTGIAATGSAGVGGFIIETNTAKLNFDCMSDANGLWTGTYTDNAAEACFLDVILPNGYGSFSAILNA